MPNSEKIELLISPEALKQFEQLKSASDANTASFEKLIAKAVELNKAVGNASTFKEINKATAEMTQNEQALAKQVDELAKANDKLTKLFEQQAKKLKDLIEAKKKQGDEGKKSADAVAKAEEKLINSYSAEARKLAEIREQQNLVNKANKQSAQETLGLSGAYKQLEQQYNKAAQEARDFAVQLGAESKEAKEASARALELDARLKAADASTGRFNRNVGNYANAFSDAFGTVGGQLKKIQQQLKSGDFGAQQLQQLQRQEGILVSITEQLGQQFSSTKQQSRSFQEAVQQIGLVFGQQSEVFQSFKDQVGEGVDSLNDIRDSIKLAASDTRQLDRLIGAATAVAGGFSIAQGAAALFGKENEDVQKALLKVQSVMAILNGLQAIQNELKNKDSILRKLSGFLIKEETKGLQAQAVAQTGNAAATNSAAKATKGFGLALKSIGIGIILTLIPLASSAMDSFSRATKKVDKDLEGMGDTAIEIANSSIKQLDDEINNLNDSLRLTPSVLDKAKKSLKLLAEESKDVKIIIPTNITGIDDAKQAFKDIVQLVKTGNTEAVEFIKKAEELQTKIRELEFLNRLKNAQAYLDAEFEAKKNAEKNIADLDKDANERRLNALQKSFDDRKITEQLFSKSSKAALQNNLNDELKIIQANLDQQLSQSGGVEGKIKQANDNATNERLLSFRNYNQKVKEIDEVVLKRQIEDAERKRKALLNILKIEVEDQIKGQDLIANNESKSFDQRTDALYAAYEKRRGLIFAQYEDELKNTKLSAEERIAIEKKYLSDINNLTIEYGLQQRDIYQQNQDAVNAIIEKGQVGRLDQISTQQANELSELDKQLRAGNISIEAYARERANIEQRYSIIALKQEVNNATAKVLATKEGTAERFAAEKELAEKTLALNDEVTKKQIEAQQRLAETKKQLAAETFETFSAFANAEFDGEIARIQKQMFEVDKQKEHDIAAANATIANKQERELAIAKIEARAQADKERLERRQRQIELERARFEKASNIAQIISSTAVAIIEALKTYKGTPQAFAVAGAIGTIGALQLARAIAAPLPKFEFGTDDAPGGLALVSEKRRELVITPDGRMMQTPSVPTVMNIPRHSIVLPDARAALESGLAVNQHGRLVEKDNNDIKDVGRKIDTLTKVMRNKPTLNMNADQSGLTAMWKYGSNWISYAEDQTRF
jgi:hypothetical protein